MKSIKEKYFNFRMKRYKVFNDFSSHEIFSRRLFSYLKERFRKAGIDVIELPDNFILDK